jgi:hypothetical protein
MARRRVVRSIYRRLDRVDIEGVRHMDGCQFCKGAKGGVAGNENNYQGVVACDYCSVLVDRILKPYVDRALKAEAALDAAMQATIAEANKRRK